MTSELLAVNDLTSASLLAALLVFIRVAGVVAFAPAFGEQTLPMRVKLGVALALTAVVLPAIADAPMPDPSLSLIVTEALIGAIYGLFLRFGVTALQIAGSVAAQSLSLSHLVAGAGGEPLPAIGHALVLSSLTLLVISGLPLALVSYLTMSYQEFPSGGFLTSEDWVERVIFATGNAIRYGAALAVPFALVALIYNLVIGAINRTMPQLMVTLIGAPAISFGALALLAITAPLIAKHWTTMMLHLLAHGGVP